MSNRLWLNIPNILTLARVFSVPVLIWLVINRDLEIAFWLFVLAGISDGLDGYIAKHFDAETPIGAYLDPIADKLLLVSAFVSLGVLELLPVWLVILVVFRDLAIVIGAGLIEQLTHNLEMAPNFSSKVNTTVQIVLVAFVFGIYGLDITELEWLITPLIYLTALTTILSGVIYLYQWGNKLSETSED